MTLDDEPLGLECGIELRQGVVGEGAAGYPIAYERGLKPIIKFCEAKTPVRVPRWYACAPLLDDPDANDKRVLGLLRPLGVVDATKTSKAEVGYAKSTGKDQCIGCKNWQGPDEPLGLECGIELRQGVVDEGAAGYRCPGYWRGAAHGTA